MASIQQVVQNPKDLAALKAELILTAEDIALLQPADWQVLSQKVSPASIQALKKVSASAGAGAPAGPGGSSLLSMVQNPADLAILKKELILTTDDAALLTPNQLQSLHLSPQTTQMLQSMSSGGAGPSSAASSGAQLVKQVISNPQDLAKCDQQLIITMEDVARLSPEDWSVLALTPESASKLKAACGSCNKPHKFQPGQPMIDDDDLDDDDDDSSDDDDDTDSEEEEVAPMCAKVSSGAKMMDKAQMSSSKKMKMKQVNQAIRAGHRLALRAELEAIRRADDLARLQKKRAELVRLYKKYKAAGAAC